MRLAAGTGAGDAVRMPSVTDMTPRRGLFLDRDGVINADRGFVARREDFVWLDGIFVLVRTALAHGFAPVIVTNQSGIGRGLYTLEDYEGLTAWMLARFATEQAPIERVYQCPYHPEAELPHYRAVHPWRKPAPGMILAAAADLRLDLARSVLVGDRWSDVEAAAAAGVGTIVLVGPASDFGRDAVPQQLVRLRDTRAAADWFRGDYLDAQATPTTPD